MVESSSVELLKRLAIRGDGICFQTYLGLEEEVINGRLVHVPLSDPDIPQSELGVYIQSGRAVSTAEAMLLEILTEEVTARSAAEANF